MMSFSSSRGNSTATSIFEYAPPRPPLELYLVSKQGVRIPVGKNAAFISPKLRSIFRFHVGPSVAHFAYDAQTLKKIVVYLENHSRDYNLDLAYLAKWDRSGFTNEPLLLLLKLLHCAMALELTPVTLILEEKLISMMPA